MRAKTDLFSIRFLGVLTAGALLFCPQSAVSQNSGDTPIVGGALVGSDEGEESEEMSPPPLLKPMQTTPLEGDRPAILKFFGKP